MRSTSRRARDCPSRRSAPGGRRCRPRGRAPRPPGSRDGRSRLLHARERVRAGARRRLRGPLGGDARRPRPRGSAGTRGTRRGPRLPRSVSSIAASTSGSKTSQCVGLVDRRALAVLDGDQAALLHRPDRLARHAAADVELLGEVDLARQHLAGSRARRTTMSAMRIRITSRCLRAIRSSHHIHGESAGWPAPSPLRAVIPPAARSARRRPAARRRSRSSTRPRRGSARRCATSCGVADAPERDAARPSRASAAARSSWRSMLSCTSRVRTKPGRDAVDADPVRAVVEREAAGEAERGPTWRPRRGRSPRASRSRAARRR